MLEQYSNNFLVSMPLKVWLHELQVEFTSLYLPSENLTQFSKQLQVMELVQLCMHSLPCRFPKLKME